MEKKLTAELLEKAKQAKTPEELAALAKEYGQELTAEEAQTYFDKLSGAGAICDDELDNVAGGACYMNVYEKFHSCGGFTCKICGGSDPNCTLSSVCVNCKYATRYAYNDDLIKCVR